MVQPGGLASGLIIAAAFGYQWSDVAAFVISALQNTRADLLLMVDSRQQSVLQAVSGLPRVHVASLRIEADPKTMAVRRFFLIRDLLGSLDVALVMLSDARDVVFQSDPFDWAGSSGDDFLIFAEESALIGRCAINGGWIERFFDSETLGRLAGCTVLCSGTMLASKGLMQQFLEAYCEVMEKRAQSLSGLSWGLDQSALNVLVRSPEFHLPCVFENSINGRFLTLYHESRFSVDIPGRLVNQEGIVIPVVHQYDRVPWLERHLPSRFLCLS